MTDAETRTQRERMLAGQLFQAGDPEIIADVLRAHGLVDQFNQTGAEQTDARTKLLAELLGSLGEDADIRPTFRCDLGFTTHIGARTYVNFGAVFLDIGGITIGEDVQIGPNVQLLTSTHPIDPVTRREGWESAEPIVIGDNVWLGGGVIVCPGVTIGENTVIGAGSVVTKDVQSDVIAAGNPARVHRSI